jgi:hypothetical protein
MLNHGEYLVRLCTEWLVQMKKAPQQQVAGRGLLSCFEYLLVYLGLLCNVLWLAEGF